MTGILNFAGREIRRVDVVAGGSGTVVFRATLEASRLPGDTPAKQGFGEMVIARKLTHEKGDAPLEQREETTTFVLEIHKRLPVE